jgi:mono/diheme cytochrome c family protein
MKRLNWPLIAAALLLSVGTALGAAASHWDAVPAADHTRTNPFAGKPESAMAGVLVYRNHCQQCHGADTQGDGRKKPSLRTQSVRSASDGDLEWFLRQGDLRHGMPSWSGIPQAQRWQVIAYLRSLP